MPSIRFAKRGMTKRMPEEAAKAEKEKHNNK
jgi:hypothetical protein